MADEEKPLNAEEIAKLEVFSTQNVEKKYDRQIRLWGLHGQNRLQSTHICLLGAGPVGSETMKNLILPGIGRFSVVDGEKVSSRDLGNNFFVEVSGIGHSRAEEVGRLLHELNSLWVEKSRVIDQDPVHVISTNDEFVRDFDVIVATNLPDSTLVKLGEQCEKWGKKLVVIHTNGMVGSVKLYAPEHWVLESKPEGEKWDLRLQNPWPELQTFVESFDMEAMKADLAQFSPDFTHVPFNVILMQLLSKWKKEHDGQLPSTTPEKEAFTATINQLGGGLSVADNFREAVKSKYLAYAEHELPQETLDIFNDEKCQTIDENSSPLWLMARAVKLFVDNEGQGYLPLVGTLPDITTKAATYVAMQKIFREKAEIDCRVVQGHLKTLLQSVNKDPEDISFEELSFFCKHASVMKVFRFPSIKASLSRTTPPEDFPSYEESGKWYLTLRAASRFQLEHGRLPGDRNDDDKADFDVFKKIATQLLTEWEFDPAEVELDEYLRELCRFGGSQIHNTAALIGGVAAQEIIKLVTEQWHPVDNTFVYSGISGSSAFFSI